MKPSHLLGRRGTRRDGLYLVHIVPRLVLLATALPRLALTLLKETDGSTVRIVVSTMSPPKFFSP